MSTIERRDVRAALECAASFIYLNQAAMIVVDLCTVMEIYRCRLVRPRTARNGFRATAFDLERGSR